MIHKDKNNNSWGDQTQESACTYAPTKEGLNLALKDLRDATRFIFGDVAKLGSGETPVILRTLEQDLLHMSDKILREPIPPPDIANLIDRASKAINKLKEQARRPM